MKSLLLALLLTTASFALDSLFIAEMMDSLNAKNHTPVEKFLESNKGSEDPEYYVLLLNYSYSKGVKEQINFGSGEAQEGDLELKTVEGEEPAGFIRIEEQIDTNLILSGIERTQKALKDFNHRLDIHFGIIHIAAYLKQWDIVAEQSTTILALSKEIENKWTWGTINTMGADPEEFMIDNIQSRAADLFYLESPEADDAIIAISKALTKYYPDRVYGFTNLGTIYSLRGDYKLAEKNYKKALRIAPEDEIVKKNIERLEELKAENKETEKR